MNMNNQNSIHHYPPIFKEGIDIDDPIDLSGNFRTVAGMTLRNFDREGGLKIRFQNGSEKKLLGVCDSLMYCIRGQGNEPNRIVLVPFGHTVETQLRRAPYPIWIDAPIPSAFVYENVKFPSELELNYNLNDVNNCAEIYAQFPFLRYIDKGIKDKFRSRYSGPSDAGSISAGILSNEGDGSSEAGNTADETLSNGGDVNEQFEVWYAEQTEDIVACRNSLFITDNQLSNNHLMIEVESGAELGFPGDDVFTFRVINWHGNLAEPMSYFRGMLEAKYYKDTMSDDFINKHPILAIAASENSRNLYPHFVIQREPSEPDFYQNDVIDWIARLICGNKSHKYENYNRIPLGSRWDSDKNWKSFPASDVYHYFEIPDRFGGTIKIHRSENPNILVSVIRNGEEKRYDPVTIETDGTAIYQMPTQPSYNRQDQIYCVKLESVTNRSYPIYLKHQKRMKLKNRPWNFFYYSIYLPEHEPMEKKYELPAFEVLKKYDDITGSTSSDNSAHKWEAVMNHHHVAWGPGDEGDREGAGHCEQMSFASLIFQSPTSALVNQSSLKNFNELQLLWAEYVFRNFKKKTTYETREYENFNHIFDRLTTDRGTICVFHSCLQKHLGIDEKGLMGIPLVIDHAQGRTTPWNNALYEFIYEYNEKKKKAWENTFNIRVRTILVANYDFGPEAPRKNGNIGNPRISWNSNNDSANFFQKWDDCCTIFLLEYNLEFLNGLCQEDSTLCSELESPDAAFYQSKESVGVPIENTNGLGSSDVFTYQELIDQLGNWDELIKHTKIEERSSFPIRTIWKFKKENLFKGRDNNGEIQEYYVLHLSDDAAWWGNPKITKAGLKTCKAWYPLDKIDEIINREPEDV